jgi:hypothetical protein
LHCSRKKPAFARVLSLRALLALKAQRLGYTGFGLRLRGSLRKLQCSSCSAAELMHKLA